MKKQQLLLAALSVMMLCAAQANAAWVLDIDIDGADDGPITYNPNFSFGGDTNTASTSSKSVAVGTNQADSIFGGDGLNFPDTYLARYTPAADGDNVNLAGQALNDDGDVGLSGPAGGSGSYDVYATWPETKNVSGGPTNYILSDAGGELFNVLIDQNTAQGHLDSAGDMVAGGEWIYLGTATLDANTHYTLTQRVDPVSGTNSFVSMRASAYLFDTGEEVPLVPEPSTMLLSVLGGLGLLTSRRR